MDNLLFIVCVLCLLSSCLAHGRANRLLRQLRHVRSWARAQQSDMWKIESELAKHGIKVRLPIHPEEAYRMWDDK